MNNFLIKIKKLIEGKHFSHFQSIFKGAGLEINDFRKYVSGDPYRYINWKLTAKHDELYIDLFHQDKDIHVEVFFDINYNRKGGIKEVNHQLVINYFADIIIYCKKNNLSLEVFYPEKDKIQRKYIGKNMSLAHQFLQKIPSLVCSTKKRYTSSLTTFLGLTKQLKKRRAIIIFSDFLSIDEKTKKTLDGLRKEHALYLFELPIGKEGIGYNTFTINHDLYQKHKKLHTIKLLS